MFEIEVPVIFFSFMQNKESINLDTKVLQRWKFVNDVYIYNCLQIHSCNKYYFFFVFVYEYIRTVLVMHFVYIIQYSEHTAFENIKPCQTRNFVFSGGFERVFVVEPIFEERVILFLYVIFLHMHVHSSSKDGKTWHAIVRRTFRSDPLDGEQKKANTDCMALQFRPLHDPDSLPECRGLSHRKGDETFV